VVALVLKIAAVSILPLVLRHDRSGSSVETEAMVHAIEPSRPWTLVDGKHWQIASPASEDPSLTDATENTRGNCPPGMVEVLGSMRIDSAQGSVEGLQDATCTNWIDRSFPERCAVFDTGMWRGIVRNLPVERMHFCIDRFEYPNRKGAYPVIAVTWYEAGSLCEAHGERLCTEDEWTFACEGEEALPYPYGYVRDASACVIDRPWRVFDGRHLAMRDSPVAVAEIDYTWQGEASGARADCRSPFGVYDMTGNVDEWTRSVRREGYRSIFKGGYWGPVRTRCRASTRAHNEEFYYYQQGFRCCADVPGGDAAPSTGDGEP
jgi:hypothetical protein